MLPLAAAAALAAALPAAAFDPGRARFTVRVNDDLVVPYRVFAVYVLPGEVLAIAVDDAAVGYTLRAAAGTPEQVGAGEWRWTAPAAPGVAGIVVGGEHDRIELNAVVMHPATSVTRDRLNDYRIGSYPPPDGDPVYAAPDGFIELNEATLDVQVSPHFRLSQFPSKQAGELPKYLVLREQLLLKLELLLEHLNDNGVAADTFTVMSGFRTPFYNHAIGNVPRSRHVYGGAADIYVDVSPRDDVMDDLNRDGRFDYRDAQWLYRLANDLFMRDEHALLRGGLGVYRRTSAHGPFLHVDARGRRARWGLLP